MEMDYLFFLLYWELLPAWITRNLLSIEERALFPFAFSSASELWFVMQLPNCTTNVLAMCPGASPFLPKGFALTVCATR